MPRKNKRFAPSRSSFKPKEKVLTYKNVYKTGKLSLMKNGRAFVEYSPLEKDIEVEMKDLGRAMHGDIVEVELMRKSASGRVKGKVSKVVKRGQKFYIGTIEKNKGKRPFFHVDSSYLLPVFFVDAQDAVVVNHGDRVVAEFVRWEAEGKPTVRIVEICKQWSATKLAYHQMLFDQKFNVGFSAKVLEEASALSLLPKDKDAPYRKDFREVFTFTIDPYDAKDFDDAISFRPIDEKTWEVGVHIADVTHFLKPKTALDEEAFERATSVYMPGYVEPMLPEHLSNHLCSLVPHEDRLCFAIIFDIDHQGEIKRYAIHKTTICSNSRFSYEEVQGILETKEGEYFPVLHTLHTIAQRWRKDRMQHGSIDFQPSEKKIRLKPNQEVEEILLETSNESHQLIEEFMLKANQYVAQHLASHFPKLLFPSRVHDLPNEEKLATFAAFARHYGHLIPTDPKRLPAALNQMISAEMKRDPYSPLPTLAIRTMAKAQYAPERIGHYGLGFEYYAHFTSPIRRYPDVILHRILFSALQQKPCQVSDLQAQCNHCNEREKASMEVERESKKYKMVEFMQQYVGSVFEAVITGVSERGMWAETILHQAEGFISLDEMNKQEPFQCFPESYCMRGVRTGKKIEIGNRIQIRVVAASTVTKKMDFQWLTKTT